MTLIRLDPLEENWLIVNGEKDCLTQGAVSFYPENGTMASAYIDFLYSAEQSEMAQYLAEKRGELAKLMVSCEVAEVNDDGASAVVIREGQSSREANRAYRHYCEAEQERKQKKDIQAKMKMQAIDLLTEMEVELAKKIAFADMRFKAYQKGVGRREKKAMEFRPSTTGGLAFPNYGDMYMQLASGVKESMGLPSLGCNPVTLTEFLEAPNAIGVLQLAQPDEVLMK